MSLLVSQDSGLTQQDTVEIEGISLYVLLDKVCPHLIYPSGLCMLGSMQGLFFADAAYAVDLLYVFRSWRVCANLFGFEWTRFCLHLRLSS